jgi:hypothetical protein
MSTKSTLPLLDESKAPVVAKPVILEKVGPGGRLRVRGVFQRVGTKNANNRIYPSSVWEKNLQPESLLVRRIAARAVLGELEHPDSGVTHLGRVSHLVEKVWRESLEEGNPYEVGPGDYILGEALILNTAPGQILRELYECKIPVGISSRGRGDVVQNSEGIDVVQDNYETDTWDFVYQPSVLEATPHPVESKIEAKTDGTELKALIERVQKTVSGTDSMDLADLVELQSLLNTKLKTLVEAKRLEYNKEDTAAVCNLLKKLSEDLESRISQREQVNKQVPRVSSVPKQRRSSVTERQQTAAVMADLAARTVRAETRLRRIQEGRPTPTSRPENSDKSLRAQLDKSLELSDGILARARQEYRKRIQLEKRLEAAVKLAHGLSRRGVTRFVEAAIAIAPELETHKKTLLECKTQEEVRTRIAEVKKVPARALRSTSAAEPAVIEIRRPTGAAVKTEAAVRRPVNLVTAVVDTLERRTNQ